MKLTIKRNFEAISIAFVTPGHVFVASDGRVYLRAEDCIVDLTPRDKSTSAAGVASCLVHKRGTVPFSTLTVVSQCGPLLVDLT
jgi:hypothetical protein